MKVLVINGPNLNMLGIREPAIYGSATYADLEKTVKTEASRIGIEVRIIQSNHEGVLIDEIQAAYQIYDGIVINPGGLTHTSVALLDALKAVGLPVVEVHISQVSAREPFRQQSFVRLACFATVEGEGIAGYCHALRLLAERMKCS